MQRRNVLLIAKQFCTTTFKSGALFATLIVFGLLLAYAAITGYSNYVVQNDIRESYQHKARESWESNPDKHPHRMAHFGTFAFRTKHPLSIFDFGLESFTGSAIFLEAHKQNTVNFSEAGFSTGLLRFGEISMAMLLQVILPLIIFFLGFGAVAADRENGTLKMVLTQGASWMEIIVGKTLGLMSVSILFYTPVIIVSCVLLALTNHDEVGAEVLLRLAVITLAYFLLYWVISTIAVTVSTSSNSARQGLFKLLGLWLVFAILLPRITQAIGGTVYPGASKVEFETAIESDLIEAGDSHNPDDPHYKAIKDSVLRAHQVDSIQQLPFNYSGFIMQEGERLSAAIYNGHLQSLLQTYEKQNALANSTAWINPLAAIKVISSVFSGTDFYSYTNFQSAAERYRYRLAQEMNALQIKLIPNTKPRDNEQPFSISRDHWQAFPDFENSHVQRGVLFQNAAAALAALALWSTLTILIILRSAKKAKAI
ncbi:DUF3526 domain-containing protein [Segetibacter sp. 3557_3]|uniref:ABC transporter permease n=1 Tax=Segetibacter sp. 3557_3 TaxID=2547429 RepID=UPI00105845CF|nr:DUF3526 domain-containing protein [Segetibacter sp. 3557_3]TDH18397.1 DUF3526 domain-containing protein [Segetibacter sp. 3557_3]